MTGYGDNSDHTDSGTHDWVPLSAEHVRHHMFRETRAGPCRPAHRRRPGPRQRDARDQAEAIVNRTRQEADQAARAGTDYNADREQAERLSALGRSILAAMSGATTQMDGASAQMRAVGDVFAAELEKLTMVPVAPGRPARTARLAAGSA
ncbi:MAG: DivIVA protein [Dactylosporangium sp.]|nr:DivIVA protein [Dactylosporangium sp.]